MMNCLGKDLWQKVLNDLSYDQRRASRTGCVFYLCYDDSFQYDRSELVNEDIDDR